MPVGLDVRLLYSLNSFVRNNHLAAQIIGLAGFNPLVRGLPAFFFIVALWFLREDRKRRSRMLIGLIAASAATFLSVWLQHRFSLNVRPFLDPSLHLAYVNPASTSNWDRLGSFPSDTATLFFALAAIIFLENRVAGGVTTLWLLFTVGVARVAMGWHYPSDIAGGMILGVTSVFLATRFRYPRDLAERLLERCEPRMYIVHAILFLFLADAYSLFPGLGGILFDLRRLWVAVAAR